MLLGLELEFTSKGLIDRSSPPALFASSQESMMYFRLSHIRGEIQSTIRALSPNVENRKDLREADLREYLFDYLGRRRRTWQRCVSPKFADSPSLHDADTSCRNKLIKNSGLKLIVRGALQETSISTFYEYIGTTRKIVRPRCSAVE